MIAFMTTIGSSLSSSLSGLQANAKRMAVSAEDVANALTTGKMDAKTGAVSGGYEAQDVVQTSVAGGGVRAKAVPSTPATVTVNNPSDPNANEDGNVALPNVDFAQERVEQITAVTGYKANAAAIRTMTGMEKALLDIKT